MLARFVRRVVALLGRFARGEISFKELVVRGFRGLFRPVRTHTFTSYSQAQQDLLFALLLPGKGRVFVDIGARDGVVISNTYLLERQFGWRGLCIAPHPGLFKQLSKNRLATAVNAAVADVSTAGEKLQFAMWQEGALGHSGLVDVDYRNVDQLADHAHEIIEVSCYPLRDILSRENIRRVDVLDIDVEGAELSVMRSIDFSACHFNIISVEGVSPEIDKILVDNNFRLLGKRGEDSIYRNDTQIDP